MDIGFGIWLALLIGMIPPQIWAASNSMRGALIESTAEQPRVLSSRSLSRILGACAAALTFVSVSTACAGEASQIAARGGFLLGHAYRCGVPTEELKPSVQLITNLIAARSSDREEQEIADEAFADSLLTGLRAATSGDPVPFCTRIRQELAEFQQRQHARLQPGSTSNVG